MTPVDELREAASRLRDLALRACAGPWRHRNGLIEGNGAQVAEVKFAQGHDSGDYIASMHPGVALALADLFAATAESYRTEKDTPECPNCGEGCAGHDAETYHYTCGDVVPCGCILSTLFVARACLHAAKEG
jgi:hypothetical protein